MYTERRIVSIKAWTALWASEIKRVKELGKNGFWCGGVGTEEEQFYPSSKLSTLPFCSQEKEKSTEEIGYKCLGDLIPMTPEDKKKILSVKGIGKKTIAKWEQKLLDIQVEPAGGMDAETPTDHRLEDNPYHSKWGEKIGEEKLRKSVTLNKFTCIKDLVTHIYESSEKMFKGTEHEDDWYFYHDALSLMTSVECIAWMKEVGYYKRWLLPQLDLLIDTPYHGKLPGDSPELMPLDNSLNKDYDDSAKRHCAVTMHLPWNENKKDLKIFSLATPREGKSTKTSGVGRG